MDKLIFIFESNPRYTITLIVIFFAIIGFFVFSKSVDSFLNKTLPNYLSLRLNHDDPYIKSFFNDDKTKREIDKIKKTIKKFLCYIFILVFLVFIFSLLNSSSPSGSDEISKSLEKSIDYGPFGDLFNGILTPLLTFSSFVFLLFTVVMQNIQMRATLNELQLSRLEMSESTDALQAQVKNLDSQKFDHIFFSLIENYKILLKDLREQKFYDDIGNEIKESYENYLFKKINEGAYSKIESFWDSVKDDFLSIFLLSYQILKYIDVNIDKIITKEDARRYVGIIRAITPKNILFLIYVNCAVCDFEKYKKLLEDFSVFEHLYFNGVQINIFKKLSSQYHIKAFGDSKRVHRYIIDSVYSLNFFYEPVNKFKDFLKNLDTSKFSGDEAISFYDFGKSLEDKLLEEYYQKIISNKNSILDLCVKNNENFNKFCRNDIGLIENYQLIMDKLINEYSLLVKHEYERLKACAH